MSTRVMLLLLSMLGALSTAVVVSVLLNEKEAIRIESDQELSWSDGPAQNWPYNSLVHLAGIDVNLAKWAANLPRLG